VLPDDFVLSDKNIAGVQARLPNRNGKTTEHAMWPGATFGKQVPDVRATACMSNCGEPAKIASTLPEHARDAHGNLAQQNRLVGPQRGADTARGAPAAAAAVATATPAHGQVHAPNTVAMALAQKHNCMACHGVDRKIVGPAFKDVAGKHAGRADAVAYLSGKIKEGGSGVWGSIPMPEQALPPADAQLIAQWLADGARL
jgi:S-disulfanyl-L-cysteine oxidoreductase SoxD